MKLPAAALLFVLSTTTSSYYASAFTPTAKPFGLDQRAELQRPASWMTSTTSALKSTIERVDVTATSQEPEYDPIIARDMARETATDFLGQYEGLTGAAALYSKLQEHGVTVVNGYSGGAVLPVLDQFHEDNRRHKLSSKPPIRWITNSNEGNVGYVTEGYAKAQSMGGKYLPCGVAVATSGPGVTNLITPLQDAICDGVPMLVLCGQAATTAPQDAFQSAPAVALTAPCTKWSYQIKSAAEIPFVMDFAFFVARNGRPGPVFIDLPKDLQNQVIDSGLIKSTVIEMFAGKGTDFARLVERTKADGSITQAFSLGREEQQLSFELQRDVDDDLLKLEPVASDNTEAFDSDHNPKNRVFFQEMFVVNGDKSKVLKEGTMTEDDPIMIEILSLIKKAKKPFLLIGQGANDSKEELLKFAERQQIPTATTLHALGVFDERHSLALNMLGMHGHPTPNFMIQESDLIICIGSRFDDRITGRMADFIPEARKAAEEGRGGVIHCDIRLSEKAKQVNPTYFVHSTCKDFLTALNNMLGKDETAVPNTGEWLERMNKLKSEFPIGIPKFPKETVKVPAENGDSTEITRTRLSAQSVIQEMNLQLLKAGRMDDCIFSTGVGIHQMVAAQLVTWTQPRQMLSSGSLGTMGVSLGYAIGGKLARPEKMVISIDGDGSFNMSFTELKTLMEQGNIPIKILLLDNASQMMVEYWQRLFHEKRYLAVHNINPEYTTLASAFNIKSYYCDSEENLKDTMNKFLFSDPDKPVLFHVRIERTPCLPLVAPGQRLENMILEDEDFEVDPAAAPS
uniref:Acetolactate synthase n=1 Tax=Grammatophora oceanica TaxID=210454 RepID=A0A7S1V0Q7_9STRA|mmetsp:Transcript_32820/g.48621  ORF Transcript_32820/g.48621 Transcript_32820/m.48621 type:complete len:797 (+) Transcript_32820:248-2638(+)|eukprot:CAMPEP_0194057274 /NCGR_PEP_ID=MMETSP0009_2-20130614/62829_1 /TAXON_ID=210454 /ORGANISM="Grammatophora oceanica, Strain CCMP 410" /LENGTH=796 /DNA_ID=CAMNT_0038706957 /DNA_START=145 /DNA_END=2535 /DNA_ORIENTATION=+